MRVILLGLLCSAVLIVGCGDGKPSSSPQAPSNKKWVPPERETPER